MARIIRNIAILKALTNGALEQRELSQQLKIPQSDAFFDQLDALEAAGFMKNAILSGISTQKNRQPVNTALRDNYLRFYLKYIEPKRRLIEQNLYQEAHLENLPEWHTIMGLPFENLVLNNLLSIIQADWTCFQNNLQRSPLLSKKIKPPDKKPFKLIC